MFVLTIVALATLASQKKTTNSGRHWTIVASIVAAVVGVSLIVASILLIG